MNALVTGGGGFLGGHIVEQLLARGDEVVVFARGDYAALADRGVRLIRGDLRDAAAVGRAASGCDTVFHVAAVTGMWGRWLDFYGPNVLGTRHVVDACRAAGVARLVYCSSPSVVFNGADQEGADETLSYPDRYESYYAKSKALGERIVLAADGPALSTCALRPHLVFGPGDPHLLPAIVDRARRGRLPQVGDGSNRVDFTYVEDAARAHLLAAGKLEPGAPAAGSAYFISQDEPVPLWPWLNALFDRLGVPRAGRRVPLRAARAAGAVLETLHRALPFLGEPRITRFLADELARSHWYDIGRARRELGYAPRFSMAEALERAVGDLQSRFAAWFKTG